MKKLFAYYDALPEPRRMFTTLGVTAVFLLLGLVVRLAGYEASGWLITIMPILFLLVARTLYLRRQH